MSGAKTFWQYRAPGGDERTGLAWDWRKEWEVSRVKSDEKKE